MVDNRAITSDSERLHQILDVLEEVRAGNYDAQLTPNADDLIGELQWAVGELIARQEFYYKFYQQSPDAYFSLNPQGRLLDVNDTLLEWLGYSRGDLVERTSLSQLLSTESQPVFEQRFSSLSKREKFTELELEFQRQDGAVFTAFVNARATYDNTGNLLRVGGAARKIDDKVAELADELKRSRVLYNTASSVMDFESLQDTLQGVVDGVADALSADRAVLFVMDMEKQLVPYIVKGGPDPEPVFHTPFEELWDGLAGWALRERKTAFSPKGIADSRESPEVQRRRVEFNIGSIIITPLIYDNEIVGVMSVINRLADQPDFTPEEVELAEVVADHAAVAVANARLFADTERRAKLLETAAEVSRAASSILDEDELFSTAVNLIRDRFDLYYVGLFLVDEAGEYAVLRTGTGEAGRLMIEREHKLKIGGMSMIGWSIANKKPRIALDVGKEAVRFDNPVLPDTRSEMALPLIYRNMVIGALTVQSVVEMAFSEDDIAALQSLAEQLATAVVNARQFELVEQVRSETEKRVRELDCLSAIGQMVSESPPIPELLHWVTKQIPRAMRYPEECVVAIEVDGEIYGAAEALDLPYHIVQTLYTNGDIAGRVYVAYVKDHIFLDEESVLLGDISRRISGYIESRRLFGRTQTMLAETQSLYRITQVMSAAEDMQEIYGTIHGIIGELTYAENFFIALYDENEELLSFPYFVDQHDSPPEPRRLGKTLTDRVIRLGQPIAVSQETYKDWIARGEMEAVGSFAVDWIGVPLKTGEKTFGALVVQSYDENVRLGEREKELLTFVSQNIASAIERRRADLERTKLLAELEKRMRELDCLNDIGQKSSESLPISDFLQWITGRIPAAMQYPDDCMIAVEFEDQIYGTPEAIELPCQAVQSLRTNGDVVGRLYVSYTKEHSFLDEESALLGDIGRRVSSYIESRFILADIEAQVTARTRELAEFESLVENATEAVAMRDLDGKLIYANRAMYELFGYDRDSEQLLGTTISDIVVEDSLGIIEDEALPAAMGAGWRGDLTMKRRDGEKFLARLAVSCIRDEQGKPLSLSSILRDVTAEVARYELRMRQIQTSTEISQEIATAPALDVLYQRVVTLVKERFGYYHAQVFRYSPEDNAMVLIEGYGKAGRMMKAKAHKLPVGTGVVGTVATTGEPVLASDVTEDPNWRPNPDLPNTKGELAVPIKLRDEVLGVLDVQSDRAGALTTEDQLVLLGLCGQIASAIQSARLVSQVQAAESQLAQRLKELSCLYDISRMGTEDLPIDEYLTLVAARVPSAMQFPELCQVAIEFEDKVYGTATAIELPCQMTQTLRWGQGLVGKVYIAYTEQRPFLDGESALIGSIAERVSGYIEQRQLLRNIQLNAERTDALLEAEMQLSQADDTEQIFQIAVQRAAEVLNAPDASIFTYDEIDKTLTQRAGYGAVSERTVGMQVPLHVSPPAERALLERKTIVEPNIENAGADYEFAAEQGFTASIILPLFMGTVSLGLLFLDETRGPREFSDEEIDAIKSLGNQIAAVLENRRLLEEEQHARIQLDERVSELDCLHDIGRMGAENLPIDEYLRLVANRVPSAMRFSELCEVAIEFEGQVYGSPAALELPWQMTQTLRIGGEIRGKIYIAYTEDQPFLDGESALIGSIAESVSSYIQRTRLFEENQAALAETSALYQAIAELSSAQDYDEILEVLRKYTLLGRADHTVSIDLFDRVWTADEIPETVSVISRWSSQSTDHIETRYAVADYPSFVDLVSADELVLITDVELDTRLGARIRDLYSQTFGANSVVFAPLVAGGQWIGYINGVYTNRTEFPADEVRRLMSLAGQAAVSIQNIRQFRQVRAQARREQRLREMTERVRAATDVDSMMQIAVQELRRSLGVSHAAIRLGSVEKLGG